MFVFLWLFSNVSSSHKTVQMFRRKSKLYVILYRTLTLCHGKAVRVHWEVGIGLGHRRGCG